MSRTWIHEPIRVLRTNPKYRHHFDVHHDHTKGPCDYDPTSRESWRGGTSCCWYFKYTLRTCSCAMCSSRFARKYNRRVVRMQERVQRQQILALVDRDDAEIFWDGRAARCWW